MIPPVPSVLAAVDFSPLGTLCALRAYSIVDDGGTVHLLHVIERLEPRTQPNPLYAHYVPGRSPSAEERRKQHAEIEERLQALIPEEAASRRLSTQVHVVEAVDVAPTIIETAAGLDAEITCMGTHGRTGLLRAVMGSVARDVMQGSRRPVLIVHGEAGASRRR